MTTQIGFTFNKDYDDLLQVEHMWSDYMARYTELEADGKYPCNSLFVGHIPAAAGENEDTAIYLLQKLRHIREDTMKLDRFIADGGREVTELDDSTVLRGNVAEFGFYMGGGGFRTRHNVRVIGKHGRPYAALPKGARTRGFLLEGRVFIQETTANR